jgi:hypothetical protein
VWCVGGVLMSWQGYEQEHIDSPLHASAGTAMAAADPSPAPSAPAHRRSLQDSGLETPATRAANPHHTHSEHVRNTAAGTHAGGFMGKVFAVSGVCGVQSRRHVALAAAVLCSLLRCQDCPPGAVQCAATNLFARAAYPLMTATR